MNYSDVRHSNCWCTMYMTKQPNEPTYTGLWRRWSHSWPWFLSTRLAPALSLAWTFVYLLFFRLVTWFGLPQPTPFSNAIQLLLTLKVQWRTYWIKPAHRDFTGCEPQWTFVCWLLLDGESSKWGAQFPHGEEEGSELFLQVSRHRWSVSGTFSLRYCVL